MDDSDFIIGLMRQGYNVEPNQLGFIPAPKIKNYYVPRAQYVIQKDRRGRPVGYFLTGSFRPGTSLKIEQAIIDLNRRNRGFGEMALSRIIERAQIANLRSLHLYIAEDLVACDFFAHCGFVRTATTHTPNKRQRAKHTYVFDLWPRLPGF